MVQLFLDLQEATGLLSLLPFLYLQAWERLLLGITSEQFPNFSAEKGVFLQAPVLLVTSFSSRFSVYVGVHVKLHQDGTMRKMYHAGHDSNMFHIEHDM